MMEKVIKLRTAQNIRKLRWYSGAMVEHSLRWHVQFQPIWGTRPMIIATSQINSMTMKTRRVLMLLCSWTLKIVWWRSTATNRRLRTEAVRLVFINP